MRLRSSGLVIWCALAALAVASEVLEPGTLSSSALLSMLPFAAILAIAAVGQGLTIQQGGLDFSVAGSMSMSAIVVTGHAAGDESKLVPAIAMALGIVALAGLVNGIAIARFRVTPIIATLAVNALLVGAVQSYSHSAPKAATDDLSTFAIGKTVGIPHTVLIAIVFVVVTSAVLARATIGRRFVAIGTSPPAARAAGLRVERYLVATYVIAALCYGVAGIVQAGYIKSPNIDLGNPYLLSSITAVVIGGTALGGGRGQIVGTAAAALFLTQLNSLISALGGPASVALLVQSAAIAIAASWGSLAAAGGVRRLRRRRAVPA
ncbi:MAG: ribose transport system permease protein [Solirubrobacteraceae bacterium]